MLVQQSETNDYLKKAVNNSEGRSNDLEKELASIETKIKQEYAFNSHPLASFPSYIENWI